MHNPVYSRENDVASPGLTHHISESIQVKSFHCLWIRFLRSTQRLRRCRPVEHHAVLRRNEPICLGTHLLRSLP